MKEYRERANGLPEKGYRLIQAGVGTVIAVLAIPCVNNTLQFLARGDKFRAHSSEAAIAALFTIGATTALVLRTLRHRITINHLKNQAHIGNEEALGLLRSESKNNKYAQVALHSFLREEIQSHRQWIDMDI